MKDRTRRTYGKIGDCEQSMCIRVSSAIVVPLFCFALCTTARINTFAFSITRGIFAVKRRTIYISSLPKTSGNLEGRINWLAMSGSVPVKSTDSDNDDSDGLGLESPYLAEEDSKFLSFDMWGYCRTDNLQVILEENQRLKPPRVHLLKLVNDYFKIINVSYFIYGGTALSVYREGEKRIEHDQDIDIAILETDFASVVKKIDSLPAFKEGDVIVSHNSRGHGWFEDDGTEIPFDGTGIKRIKFFATRKLLAQFGIPDDDELFDIGLVHLDVFTLSQHPDNPDCFCVNWSIPGLYDFRRKAFPKSIFSPLKTYSFEGLEVTGVNDLKAYLEREYGYLGRGAAYDSKTQLYVKIPDNVFEQLPDDVQWSMASDSRLSLKKDLNL